MSFVRRKHLPPDKNTPHALHSTYSRTVSVALDMALASSNGSTHASLRAHAATSSGVCPSYMPNAATHEGINTEDFQR